MLSILCLKVEGSFAQRKAIGCSSASMFVAESEREKYTPVRTQLNRQSRHCLIRYLEVAKSLLIYPRACDAGGQASSTREARLMGQVLKLA